ncbi:MAG: choice-of-anchor I family protein [Crocinitomicaceae bacterium]|nr:choice-of-anchor I family protein [Crocinitomicaceae bacterium]
MTKKITFSSLIFFFALLGRSQNPGLLISEFLQNPAGTDSPFEYVELLAVDNIDFSVTPYTVIVSNNGTATTDGWIEGLGITYAFEITTGTVSVGDVVYVGGSTMAPTGPYLRVINTGTTGGDGGIGNSNASGVFGNGTGNSDGIAIFNVAASSINSTTVPVDAVFYGGGPDHGGAVVSAGAAGYELPNNELYSGGKLQQTSFLAVDEDLTIATGVYNELTNTFTVPRTFATGTATDGVSAITFASATPPGLSFTATHLSFDEDAGTVSFDIAISSSNTTASSADIIVKSASTATSPADFTLASTTVTFAPSSTGTQTYSLTISDDLIEEASEYIIITLDNFVNAELTGTEHTFIYIADNDRIIPAATNELKFETLTSYSNGAEGSNSAEIVAYDSSNYKLFIANSIGNNLDIVDFSNPAVPVAMMSINLDSIGSINSVAVYNGVVAVALQDLNPQLNGSIAFFDGDGNWLKRLEVGAMPDMLTFSKDGAKLVIACEGEPSDDYLTDPEGTVAVLDMLYPATTMTNLNVTLVNFNSLDGTEATLMSEGIRIYGPGSSASQDFEPEYVTILSDGETAFITLQENNAVAIINIQTKALIDVVSLGTIDHNVMGYGMDVSNVTTGIRIANFPVKGLFLPDAIASLSIGGADYLFTANEGDTRAWGGYDEETRVKDIVLDPTVFPDAAYLQDQYLLGRLLMTTSMGDELNDGDFEEIYTVGNRSFSIWDASGTLVFDSGDMIELIISNHPEFQNLFNASNTAGGVTVKNRSDDKGPEVEGVAVATIEGNHFVFVSLERVGGVLIFNVNDPANPQYVGYENNRDLLTNGPDRGAEGIIYIDAASSPNGNSLLLLANEISSTVSVFQLNSCSELSDLAITTDNDAITFCENDSLKIEASSTSTLDYQWFHNGSIIAGSDSSNTYAYTGGFYQVEFENTVEQCMGKTDSLFLDELPAPIPTITVTNAVLSTGVFTTYQWYFEGSPISGETNQEYTPTTDGDYSVSVTNADGCEGTESYTVDFTTIAQNNITQFSVYPNPANDKISVVINEASESVVTIRDTKGSVVYEAALFNDNSVYEINIGDLQNGMYFISITTTDEIKTTSFIVKN